MRYQLWSFHKPATFSDLEFGKYFIVDKVESRRTLHSFSPCSAFTDAHKDVFLFLDKGTTFYNNNSYSKIAEAETLEELEYSVPWLFI